MSPNPHARLYSPDAAATVRAGVTATDGGTWVPTADDQIIDAREWDHLHVFPEFVGGAGTSITLVPLVRVRTHDGSVAWLELPAVGPIGPKDDGYEVDVDGHFASFRVTGLSLGAATSVRVRVTGGEKRLDFPG